MVLGYATGVFDLFHIGHLNLLKNAKAICDKLIVGVTTDELMLKYKSKKTIIPFNERFEIVRNIKFVDAVIPQESMNKFEVWQKLKFDIMFVGDDWFHTAKWEDFERQFNEVGVRIVYFPYTKGTSSTLINKILMEERDRIEMHQLDYIEPTNV
jgi:glycerol-3-phosphate cytidylyltransferase